MSTNETQPHGGNPASRTTVGLQAGHASKARKYLDDASDEYTREGGPIPENVRDWVAIAQVHAILAVAEALTRSEKSAAMPEPHGAYLTVAQAAVRLDMSEKTIRNFIADATLPASRVGKRQIRIKRADVEKMLKPVTTW